ncbi:MAG: hypothetical protein R6V85_20580 [Polyangia bacterium]
MVQHKASRGDFTGCCVSHGYDHGEDGLRLAKNEAEQMREIEVDDMGETIQVGVRFLEEVVELIDRFASETTAELRESLPGLKVNRAGTIFIFVERGSATRAKRCRPRPRRSGRAGHLGQPRRLKPCWLVNGLERLIKLQERLLGGYDQSLQVATPEDRYEGWTDEELLHYAATGVVLERYR